MPVGSELVFWLFHLEAIFISFCRDHCSPTHLQVIKVIFQHRHTNLSPIFILFMTISAIQCISILQVPLYTVVLVVSGGVFHSRTRFKSPSCTRESQEGKSMYVIQCYSFYLINISLISMRPQLFTVQAPIAVSELYQADAKEIFPTAAAPH